MFKALLVGFSCLLLPITVNAAQTFMLSVAPHLFVDRIFPEDWEIIPEPQDPSNGNAFYVDLRNINQFRISSQAFIERGGFEVTVQVSLDNGKTWNCLGTPSCVVQTIMANGFPYDPSLPTPIYAIPTNQRKSNTLIRPVFRGSGGEEETVPTDMQLFNFMVQFYGN